VAVAEPKEPNQPSNPKAIGDLYDAIARTAFNPGSDSRKQMASSVQLLQQIGFTEKKIKRLVETICEEFHVVSEKA
jgi:hypothetical protein